MIQNWQRLGEYYFPSKITQSNLNTIKERISKLPNYKLKNLVSKRRAAILLPIVNSNGKSSILYTLRSSKLNEHAGEVSFPGGMEDEIDQCSPIKTAIRETYEELGIDGDKIEILGKIHEVPSKTGITVTPVIGWLGEYEELEMNVNKDEIDEIFTVSFESLLDVNGRTMDVLNRGLIPRFHNSPHQIWGLTAYVTDYFLSTMFKETQNIVHNKL